MIRFRGDDVLSSLCSYFALKRLPFLIPSDEPNRQPDTTCTFERCTRVFTLEK